MRERLVAAFVGLTVLVVALYGIPRAYFLADLVRSEEQSRVDRTAEMLARVVAGRLADGEPVTTAWLDSVSDSGEWLTVSGVPGVPGGTVETTGDPDLDGAVQASRDVPGAVEGAEVTVTRTGTAVGAEIARALLPLVLLGLLLAALAALFAFVLAGRFSRPFRELAVTARGLGEGRLHPEVPRYDVPEARAIGRALVEAGSRLDLLLARERLVAVHASHELRTPVTALRLELEDLALWPETPTTVATQLRRGVEELDRLTRAITELLELADSHRAASEIDLDLDALLADTAARLAAGGVPVEHEPSAPALTRLDPLPVIQVLEVLVAEAVAAGAERVTVSCATRSGHVELLVTGTPDGAHHDSVRWTTASDLAHAAGGQVARQDATLVLRLPRRTPVGDALPS